MTILWVYYVSMDSNRGNWEHVIYLRKTPILVNEKNILLVSLNALKRLKWLKCSKNFIFIGASIGKGMNEYNGWIDVKKKY